jgi:cellulose synthase/poly-beta-1,6-N-acetylglucosamine synthase-like glycosyltransferase
MIIQVLSNLFEEGYLKRDKYSVLSAFFACANVAFRKKALDQTGLYDLKCYSGEDQDMTLRISQAGWELYFEPKASVKHKNKMTTKGFARKWYDYGYHHPYIFKKHVTKGINFYITGRKNVKRNSGMPMYKKILGIKSPLSVNVFLTSFLLTHFLALIAIILAVLGISLPALIIGVMVLILAIVYFKDDFAHKQIGRSLAFVFYRYVANIALILGGFLGGIKFRTLYISPTFDFSN